MALRAYADNIKRSYIDACNAVIARGGNVTSGMPISDLSSAILNIPHDKTLAYYKQENTKRIITVPRNSEPYARIGKIGGMTYKTENLIPFPYDYNVGDVQELSGVKFTILADGGISIVGTPAGAMLFTIISTDVVDLTNVCQAGKQYTISGGQTGILVVAHRTPIDGAIQSTAWIETNSTQSSGVMPEGYKLYRIGIYLSSSSVGTAINTVIYPMLNEGTVAKPYSQFFNGLRNAAVSEMKSEGAKGHLDTLPVPTEIQALDGYGLGKSETEYNYIDFERKVFKQDYGKVRLLSALGGYNADTNWYYIGVGIGIAPISRDVLCNLLPSVDIAAYTEAEGIYMNSSLSHIILRKSGFTTQEEYRQWLADNEVYIIERLSEPVLTDISEYLTDEFIKVEGDGTITAVSEHNYDMPTEVNYIINTVGG